MILSNWSHGQLVRLYNARHLRLEKLKALDAPQIIIDTEKELVSDAYDKVLLKQLIDMSSWEIDIMTGEVTILKTTDYGRLILAMLELSDDGSPEE